MIIHVKEVYTRCQGAHERNIYIKKDAQNQFLKEVRLQLKLARQRREKDLEKRGKGNRTASVRRGITKRKLSGKDIY